MPIDSAALLARASSGEFDASSSSSEDDGGEQQSSGETSATASESLQADTPTRERGADGKFAKAGGAKAPPVVQQKGQPPQTPPAVVDEGDIDPDKPETHKPTHRIDFERFSSVLGRATKAEQELAAVRRELEIAREVRRQQPQGQADSRSGDSASLIDEIWGPEDGQGGRVPQGQTPEQREIAELKAWRQNVEKQQQTQRALEVLDGEVARVRGKYPHIPERILHLEALAGRRDLEGVAEEWQGTFDAMRQRGATPQQAAAVASAETSPASSQPNAAPPAPPRLRPAGSAALPNRGSKDGVNFADSDQRRAWALARAKALG